MRGVVWGYTFEQAAAQLDKIEKDYTESEFPVECLLRERTKDSYKLIFSNTDIWRALPITLNIPEDVVANVSYFPAGLNKEVIKFIMSEVMIAPPFQAYNSYFTEEQMNEILSHSEREKE